MKHMTIAGLFHGLNDRLFHHHKHDEGFHQHLQEYNKHYATKEEYRFRRDIFRKNMEIIEEHNARNDSGYTMGINHMIDWTEDEYKRLLGMKGERPDINEENVFEAPEGFEAPSSVDWRTKGYVTAVKNQGQCGSCWSFSTTGGLEGANVLAGNTLTSFSEEQLVQCSSAYGNMGCNGGLMTQAFQYLMATPDDTESVYPYTSGEGVTGTCNTVKEAEGVVSVKTYKNVGTSESAMLAAIAQQPISIGVDAGGNAWQLYSSGIVSNTKGLFPCQTAQIDHGVLLVGYTSDAWIVKNSWGATWGESGYIRLARTSSGVGTCAMYEEASFPTV